MVYYIPLFADCKFRNRLHPASDIGVPNESAWSCENSQNAAPEAELRQADIPFNFDILIFQLPPEALHFYIIQTTSPPVHVDLNAMDPKFLYELQAGELEDSISGATTVIQSFSDPGTPLDNAAAESFFACMKREKLSHNLY